MKNSKKDLTKTIATVGLMTALMSAGKSVLAFAPNIEIVSFMIIMFSVHFGKKTMLAVFSFVMLEGLFFGFTVWWLGYVYTWPLLCLISCLLGKKASRFSLTVISTLFGLSFGFLFSFVYIFTGSPNPGLGFALTWWAAGIPYDLVHGVGNLVVMLVLYKPVLRVLKHVS